MSASEYTTAANLPLRQICDPMHRALVLNFIARHTAGRTGAALVATLRRAG